MPKGMKLSMSIFGIVALVLVFNFPVVCLGLLMYAGKTSAQNSVLYCKCSVKHLHFINSLYVGIT